MVSRTGTWSVLADVPVVSIGCCLLLFIIFSVLVVNPEKLLYTVPNLSRGLLNREKITKGKSLAAHENQAKHLQVLRRSRSMSCLHKDYFDSSTRSRVLLRKMLRFRVR